MSVNEPLQPNYNFAWVKADNTRLTKEELHNQRRQDMNEKPEAWTAADSLIWPHLAAKFIREKHAENKRLRELLTEARGAKWLVVQDNLLDRIDAALRREA